MRQYPHLNNRIVFIMQCTKCDSDVDQASRGDDNFDTDNVTMDFECQNEECGLIFRIEFHPVNVEEIEP